jgi:hypothetical protein
LQAAPHFNLSRRGVEIEGDLNGVPGLDAGCVAYRAIQTQQELAAHAHDRRAPRVSVHRRDDWKPLGALSHGRHVLVIEHDRGCPGRAA